MSYARSVLGLDPADLAFVQRLADAAEPEPLEEVERLRRRPRLVPYDLPAGREGTMRKVVTGSRAELVARGVIESPSMSPEAIQDRLDEFAELEELYWGAELRNQAFAAVVCDQAPGRTSTRFRLTGAR